MCLPSDDAEAHRALPDAAASRERTPRPGDIREEWDVLGQGQVVQRGSRGFPVAFRHRDPTDRMDDPRGHEDGRQPKYESHIDRERGEAARKLADSKPSLFIDIEHGRALTSGRGLR